MPIFLVDVLYNTVCIPFVRLGLFILGTVHPKLKKRRSLLAEPASSGLRSIWFHAASMGEFEQLAAVIPLVRKQLPRVKVVVTLWSPSGYDRARRHRDVDDVYLLPADSSRRMRQWMRLLRPQCIIINRYDVWRNMVVEASRQSVPMLLVNATIPSAWNSAILRSWIKDTYCHFTQINAVNQHHADGFASMLQDSSTELRVVADTRTDVVLERAEHPVGIQFLDKEWSGITLIAGSTWSADEDLLLSALDTLGSRRPDWTSSLRLILVPHEPTPNAVKRLCQRFNAVPLSAVTDNSRSAIVVDSVGMLLGLYAIADAAFVGGGFGAGVHSVTEPAAFGVPIACGPNISRSADAVQFHTMGLLRVTETPGALVEWLTDVFDQCSYRETIGARLRHQLEQRRGSAMTTAQQIVSLCGFGRQTG